MRDGFLSCLILAAFGFAGCSTVPPLESVEGYVPPDALTESLEHEQSFIRELAARDLGRVGNRDAVELLLARLGDDDEKPFVKSAIVEALGRIGDGRAVPALTDQLIAGSHEEIRFRCVIALAALNEEHPEVTGALENALRDESLLVRTRARAALVRIREDAP